MLDRAEILFLCTPNTAMDRMAEGAARARLSRVHKSGEYTLSSASLPPDLLPPAGPESLRDDLGASYALKGRTLDESQLAQADLVLVMSTAEQHALSERYPSAARKTFLLSEMGGERRDVTGVKDPTDKEFRRLFQTIDEMVGRGFEGALRQAKSAREATMARIGLSTSLFHSEFFPHFYPSSMDEVLKILSESGARFADFSLHMAQDVLFTPEELDRYAELYGINNLTCEQVHGFESTTVHAVADGEELDHYVAVQSNRVKLCGRLGGDAVVVHIPGLFWGHMGLSLREALERSTVALDRIRPLCERLGVRLAVENYREQSSRDRLDFYLDRYPEEFMGWCLDTGHANLVEGEMDEIEPFADRIIALHLHDNAGDDDHHQPPFFGTVDWRRVFDMLQRVDYRRSLNFELIYDRNDFHGGPMEFVEHSMRRIRRAVDLRPDLTRGGGG